VLPLLLRQGGRYGVGGGLHETRGLWVRRGWFLSLPENSAR